MTTSIPAGSTQRTRWSAVLAVSLGIVLAALDMTIVAVALPALGADLRAAPSLTQWVLLAYSLPLVALSIPAGRWLDRAGPRPAFLLAVGGFGATSVLIALSPTFAVLLAGRALQGVFGSLIGVVGMPIIAASVRAEHRARAMSIVLTLIPLSGVAGPAVGGVLAEAYGWRSVFLINIPVVLVAVWFAKRAIPARLPGRAGLPLPGLRLLRETLVLGAGVTALFLALDMLTGTSGVLLPTVLGLVAVAAILGWARLPESRPVRAMMRRRQLSLPLLALPMVTTGIAALNFLVPYFFADVLGSSPRVIGLALLAVSAAMAVTSPLAGVLADRLGHRPVALSGTVVALAGMLALLLVDSSAGPLDVAWRLALVGAGNGLFAGPNAAAILTHTPDELLGTSSGVTALLRTLGFSIGPAVGALSWTLTGGGTAGFQTGVLVLAVAAALSIAAVSFAGAPRSAAALRG